MEVTEKRSPGRPRVATPKVPDKSRNIGRIRDEVWEELKSAAERSGKTFTEWAVNHLLTAARSERKSEEK